MTLADSDNAEKKIDNSYEFLNTTLNLIYTSCSAKSTESLS